MDKIYYIENKQTKERILSTRNNYFQSKEGAFLAFCNYYRHRKSYGCKHYFTGVPKKQGPVPYSQDSTEEIKIIFETYFDVVEVNI